MSHPCVIMDPIVSHTQFLKVHMFSKNSGSLSQGSGFSQSAGDILIKKPIKRLIKYNNTVIKIIRLKNNNYLPGTNVQNHGHDAVSSRYVHPNLKSVRIQKRKHFGNYFVVLDKQNTDSKGHERDREVDNFFSLFSYSEITNC